MRHLMVTTENPDAPICECCGQATSPWVHHGDYTFDSTQAMIAALPALPGDTFALVGAWEVDDDGAIYDFDGEEIPRGISWEDFKKNHAAYLAKGESGYYYNGE